MFDVRMCIAIETYYNNSVKNEILENAFKKIQS